MLSACCRQRAPRATPISAAKASAESISAPFRISAIRRLPRALAASSAESRLSRAEVPKSLISIFGNPAFNWTTKTSSTEFPDFSTFLTALSRPRIEKRLYIVFVAYGLSCSLQAGCARAACRRCPACSYSARRIPGHCHSSRLVNFVKFVNLVKIQVTWLHICCRLAAASLNSCRKVYIVMRHDRPL